MMASYRQHDGEHDWGLSQGSKKPQFGRPGQVDFPFGQVTFSSSLPHEQGPGQTIRWLTFWQRFWE